MKNVLFLQAESGEKGGHFFDTQLLRVQGELAVILPAIPNDLAVLFAFHLSATQLKTYLVPSKALLLVLSAAGRVCIGPYVEEGRSPCLACLSYWLERGSRELGLASGRGSVRVPEAREVTLAASLVAAAVDEFTGSGAIASLAGVVTSVDIETLQRADHPIFPLRNCSKCAGLADRLQLPLTIHCSPLTGIIRNMKLTSNLSAGAFRAMADWVPPLSLPGARPPLKIQDSYGRGATPDEAQAGCIGEALERYSLVYRGDEPLQRGRMADLPAVDPRSILLYSDAQYSMRKEWNANHDERYFVGEPFDAEGVLDWLPAYDLQNGSEMYVPAACCLMWYYSRHGDPELARADTIGCGSGSTPGDAVAHALLEWIERDAIAIWWYNRAHRPRVALDAFEDERFRMAQRSMAAAGRDLYLLDVTTDLGIPVYVSAAPRFDGSEPIFAGAAHPSPRVAAWKAVSEAGQICFSAQQLKAIETEIWKWTSHATLQTQPYLKHYGQVLPPAEPPHLTAVEQVDYIVRQMTDAGLQPLVVNLSRPDVLLHTVRALVPGLRHIWNRRAPGRLYELPVKLGWRQRPLAEEELNPICCMI